MTDTLTVGVHVPEMSHRPLNAIEWSELCHVDRKAELSLAADNTEFLPVSVPVTCATTCLLGSQEHRCSEFLP